MPEFIVTFEATGTMTVKAENEAIARELFKRQRQYLAWNELKANGINIVNISRKEQT